MIAVIASPQVVLAAIVLSVIVVVAIGIAEFRQRRELARSDEFKRAQAFRRSCGL